MSGINTVFIDSVGIGYDPDPDDDLFSSLFNQYQQVIFRSIITSFGLDAFIQDRHGGDVDTVRNVRSIGSDEMMTYKNAGNMEAYGNQGQYVYRDYHDRNQNYRSTKSNAREYARENTNGVIKDDYTGGDLAFSKSAPAKVKAELDHVISAKTVHDDRGRVLASLNGTDLANSPDNLKFTNKSLNASMGTDDIPDYIKKHPELPDETKAKMMEHYSKSKKSYETTINYTYYASPAFWKDTGKAAASLGGKMALRQALGFFFTEIWFSVKEKLESTVGGLKSKIHAIAEGIKRGLVRVKRKFKELLSSLFEGAAAGILSSLTTTLCNIFFTTAKHIVRVIRQTWASIVEASKILFFNPDRLPFGERMRAALKIIATGASVVVGTVVQTAVNGTLTKYVGIVPGFGSMLCNIVSTFAGSMCTGFLTISLLFAIDNDPFCGYISGQLGKTINDYKRQAELFEAYAAELVGINIDELERETAFYRNVALQLRVAESDIKLNRTLLAVNEQLHIPIPWGERSLSEFMRDKSAVLCFKT
jgi:hypothetical protein